MRLFRFFSALKQRLVENRKASSCAGLFVRLAALLIDHLIVLVIFTILLVTFGLGGGAASAESFGLSQIHTLFLVAVLLFFLINIHLLFNRGQSLGKALMSIRIVDKNHQPLPRKQLIKRFFFYWGLWLIPVYGTYLVIADCLAAGYDAKKAIHDRVAGSRVVPVTVSAR